MKDLPLLPYWAIGFAQALSLLFVPGESTAADYIPKEREDQKWRVQSLGDDAGLSRVRVNHISFEKNGNAWLSTGHGLYRYDGYSWRRYTTDDGLPSLYVKCTLLTRAGTLWVGTDKGAGTFDGKNYDDKGSAAGLAGPSVRRIIEDEDGTIWFCSDDWPDMTFAGGISSLAKSKWRAFHVKQGLPSEHVLNYFRDSRGRAIALTSVGAAVLNGDEWIPLPEWPRIVWGLAESTDGKLVEGEHPLCKTKRGEVLDVTNSEGCLVIRKYTSQGFVPISPPLDYRIHDAEDLGEAPDGSVWCVGMGFVARWEREGEWKEYPELPPPRLADTGGSVWFADADRAVQKVESRFVPRPEMGGELLQDGAGAIWSWSEKHQRIVRFDGRATTFRERETGLRSLQGAVINVQGSFVAYGEGHFHGLCLSTYDGGAWKTQAISETGNETISSAARDPTGGIWFLTKPRPQGTRCATVAHVSETGQITISQIDYGSFDAGQIYSDALGQSWVYGLFGLYSLAKPQAQWSPVGGFSDKAVWKVIGDADGTWFISENLRAEEGGLSLLRKGIWTQYEVSLAPAPSNVTAALFDDHGIYLASPRGFYSIPASTRQIGEISVPGDESLTSFAKGKDGAMWLGTSSESGRSVLRYKTDLCPPRTIAELVTDKIPQGSTLRVRFDGVERFRSRSRSNPFQFCWSIDGGEWTKFQAAPLRGIALGGVDPGKHCLSVCARDQGLDVARNCAELSFTVLPTPLQERIWFKPALCGLGALICGLALFSSERAVKFARANIALRREMTAREMSDRALTDERRRVGRELHDTLEQGLTAVRFHLDAARLQFGDRSASGRHLDIAGKLLCQSQEEVHRSVWDLRSQLLDKRDLESALRQLTQQISHHSAEIVVRAEGGPRCLEKPREHHLLRIAQEAIANALRHGQARKVETTLYFGNDQLTMSITDNGTGFDESKQYLPDEGHFGLQGMRERVRKLSGRLRIRSSQDGTEVRVDVPMSA